MIEISTPAKKSHCTDNVQPENCRDAEGLSEDDQLFFSTIREELDKLTQQPGQAITENILRYSRSL